MIYLIIVGVILLGVAVSATIYCMYVYSAMLEDIDTLCYDSQVNDQPLMAIGSKLTYAINHSEK